jgi:hypothetical protein
VGAFREISRPPDNSRDMNLNLSRVTTPRFPHLSCVLKLRVLAMHRLCDPLIFPETSWLPGSPGHCKSNSFTTDEFTRAGSLCKCSNLDKRTLLRGNPCPRRDPGCLCMTSVQAFDGANMTPMHSLLQINSWMSEIACLYSLHLFCLFLRVQLQ